MRWMTAGIFSMMAVVLVCNADSRGGGDKPKYTIKQVMQDAHKKGLMKKVADGAANAEEKKKLLDMYQSLSQNKSPAGEADDWKKKTDALVKLAKAAHDGEDVGAKLSKAANCKACHDVHKK